MPTKRLLNDNRMVMVGYGEVKVVGVQGTAFWEGRPAVVGRFGRGRRAKRAVLGAR